MKVLVTGSSGLIGAEAVAHYDRAGHQVFGIDNNLRRQFFGPAGDTRWNLERLRQNTRRFTHVALDIRDRQKIMDFFKAERFDLIIHCAAQPSHDKAKEIPFVDFDVNAVGTLNLLEATRQSNPDAVFIFMSTNKVYGDAPNELPLRELATRWDYARPEDYNGIREDCRIDRTLHSLFGASKTAADVVAQEYGKYFGMNVGVFRGGCLTGKTIPRCSFTVSFPIYSKWRARARPIPSSVTRGSRCAIRSTARMSSRRLRRLPATRDPAKFTISAADAATVRPLSSASRKLRRCSAGESRCATWMKIAWATTSATSAI